MKIVSRQKIQYRCALSDIPEIGCWFQQQLNNIHFVRILCCCCKLCIFPSNGGIFHYFSLVGETQTYLILSRSAIIYSSEWRICQIEYVYRRFPPPINFDFFPLTKEEASCLYNHSAPRADRLLNNTRKLSARSKWMLLNADGAVSSTH